MSGVAQIFGDLSEGIPSPRPQPEARPRSRQLSTRKDMLAAGLVTLVLLSSIPAGGTPPLVTAMIATALGAMGFIAGFAIPAPRKTAGHRPAALLLAGAALCAVGLLQAGLAYLPLQATPLANRDLLLRPGSLSPDATLLAVLRAAAALLVLWLAQSVASNPTRARVAALTLFAGIAAQAVWRWCFWVRLARDRILPILVPQSAPSWVAMRWRHISAWDWFWDLRCCRVTAGPPSSGSALR